MERCTFLSECRRNDAPDSRRDEPLPQAHKALWARSEISLLGTHLVSPVSAVEIDSAECAVVLEVGRGVVERVLAAQLFFNTLEAGGHFLNRGREEDLAAGRLGHVAENFLALAAARGPIGADGVDDGFGALGHFDGVQGTLPG